MLLINSDLGLFSSHKHQRKVQLAYSVDIKRLCEWLLDLTLFTEVVATISIEICTV